MPRNSRCSYCDHIGHTRRKCPYWADTEIVEQSVFCFECAYASIPYKTKQDVADMNGKKVSISSLQCGRCSSSNIEDLKKKQVKITIKRKAQKQHLKTKHMMNINNTNDSTLQTCFICYEEYTIERNSAVTPCGHRFCLECIIKHSQSNTSCPMCRASLVQKPVQNVEKWKYNLLDEIRDRIT